MQGMTYTEIFSKGAMIVGGTLVAGGCIPEGFGADFIIHSGNNTNTTLPADSPDKHDLGIILVASGGAAQLIGGVLFFGGLLVHKCFVKPVKDENTRLLERARQDAAPAGDDAQMEITREEQLDKARAQTPKKEQSKIVVHTDTPLDNDSIFDSDATSTIFSDEDAVPLKPVPTPGTPTRDMKTLTLRNADQSNEGGSDSEK